MTGIVFRTGTPTDIDTLVPVVRDFHADEGIPWDEASLRTALADLLAHPHHGRLLLVERNGVFAGYLVIGFCFSLEFGGRFGLLDELYLLPQARGGGLGRRALEEAADLCRREGLRALRLEVDNDNTRAQGVYLQNGYAAHPRQLMTRWLDR
ncbi:GNAT family N-acetyltransferase [Luteimonas aestuarii]|uniref:GNAT family N-acetyltransferase n=1 Tax=Luteimonas aestuarii TaxID=453837 RepID=A0A4V6PLL8_9GAMM|nr:GNAT family N-acetyltransferase [Luteimonas aestuarii]TDK22313.1 GNAT family N-acetyltransferase [Luteimonas aestuarii]